MQAVCESGGEMKRIEKNFVKSGKKCLTNTVQSAIILKLSDERSAREDNNNLKSFSRKMKKVLDKLKKL